MTRILIGMKSAAVVGLLAILAAAGALSAFAATRTVETSVDVEVEFWVSLSSRSAFVSTRQLGPGHEWITHDFRVELEQYPGIPTLLVGDPVTISVPVSVEVDVNGGVELPFTPLTAATPHVPPTRRPRAARRAARCGACGTTARSSGRS